MARSAHETKAANAEIPTNRLREAASYLMMGVPPRSCERARSRVSLDLDGELSELEGAMLRAHAVRCPACAAFQAEASAFTDRLRLSPLEPLPAPMTLPPRRRTVARFTQVGAAAAVAVLAAGIGTSLSTSTDRRSLTASVPPPTTASLSLAYLDAPRGLPQYPLIAFHPRIGLKPGRDYI